jgi:hypothetical protein
MHIDIGIVMEIKITLDTKCIVIIVKLMTNPTLPFVDYFLDEFFILAVAVFSWFFHCTIMVSFWHFFL